MRRDDDLKVLFQEIDKKINVDEKRKYQTLELLSKRVDEKKITCVNNWVQILKSQWCYMEKKLWMIDLGLNIVFILLFTLMRSYDAAVEEITVYSMLVSSILGVVSILILSNIFTKGIVELSATCYFNVTQLASMQIVILGVINLVTLTFAMFYVGIQWKISFFRIGIYVAVPFLFTVSVCMGGLLTETFRNRSYHVVVTGILSVIVILILTSIPKLYCASAIMFWCIGFAVGVIMLFIQVRQLFVAINKGEILCID